MTTTSASVCAPPTNWKSWGEKPLLVMMRLDRDGLSLPEQELVPGLDEVVISRFEPLTYTARRLYKDPVFMLDCLYGDDAIARKLALKRLREITNKPIRVST